jgi:alpha-beta hydrolase superfamily lysophospholipase
MRRSFRRVAAPAALAVASMLALGACAPTVTGLGAPLAPPVLEADRYVARDGTVLALRRWEPAQTPRAIILALHGFGDYAAGFEIPAAEWAASGIATIAYDQRGFGASPTRGRWPGSEALMADLADTVDLLRARHPGIPLFVLGESMGGAVAMIAAAHGRLGKVDGLVLSAPAVRGSAAIGPVGSFVLKLLAHSVPWLAGPSGSQAFRPTDNEAVLRAWAADPLILRHPRIDMAWGLVGLMDEAVAAAPRLDLPLLVLVGARDALVPGGAMARMIASLPETGREQRRIAVYETGWHLLLRDLDAARVRADVAHWVRAGRGGGEGLPSGADRPEVLSRNALR